LAMEALAVTILAAGGAFRRLARAGLPFAEQVAQDLAPD
jgi:hypothetical protein